METLDLALCASLFTFLAFEFVLGGAQLCVLGSCSRSRGMRVALGNLGHVQAEGFVLYSLTGDIDSTRGLTLAKSTAEQGSNLRLRPIGK